MLRYGWCCILSPFVIPCEIYFDFTLVETYETFVSCYENNNIPKYQAKTVHSILCVMCRNF